MGVCLVIGFLGRLLKLPSLVIDLSPFQHTPQLPAADLSLGPLAIMTTLSAGLIAIGVGAFRRRDVG